MKYTARRGARGHALLRSFALCFTAAIALCVLAASSSNIATAASASGQSAEPTGASGPTGNSEATSAPAVEAAAAPTVIRGRIADRHSVGGDGVRVRGTLSAPGRATVTLRARRVGGRSWSVVDRARVAPGKRFALRWRGGRPGRYLLKLVARSANGVDSDRLGAAYVYRRSFASWYGPGFYGRRTACGQTLTGSIVGVAHKTLPCGSRVTFHHRGRTVTARVIDRGPFVGGREWDLAPALKRRLGFGSTGVVNVTR